MSLSVGSGNFLFLGGINLQATEEAGLAGPLQYHLTGTQQLDNLNGKLTLEQCDPILLDPKTEGYNFLDNFGSTLTPPMQ